MRLVRVAAITGLLTLVLAAPASAGIIADLSVTKTDSPDPVTAGANLTYTITVANSDNSTAANVSLSDPLPAGTTFVSLTGPAGWTLTTPPVGGTGTAPARLPPFRRTRRRSSRSSSTSTRVFKPGIITNVATVTSDTSDVDTSNNASTATTNVVAAAASVPDAAMAASRPGSPLTTLGFAALLAGLLATTAVMAVRRPRT